MLHLTVVSDPAWVELALRDLGAVLVDHAHCELKAAANALSMAARHPDDARVVQALTDLAREEIDHFQRVHAVLEARHLALGNPPVDPYVAALRRAQGSLGPSPVSRGVAAAVDRLLTCALIEARSCERFALLARELGDTEPDLAAFYAELRTSEARHYRTFIDLAVHVAEGDEAGVVARLRELAAVEGAIVTSRVHEDARATIHG
jgi:tRNA-(ms[2]io[6]A)-hydroxylase